MWFIGVEVKQETSAPPPKKNPGSAPGSIAVLLDNFDEFLAFVLPARDKLKSSQRSNIGSADVILNDKIRSEKKNATSREQRLLIGNGGKILQVPAAGWNWIAQISGIFVPTG